MEESAKKSKKKRSFWKGVRAEFKKITWPDKDSLIKQAIAVVCVSLVLGLIISILDFGIQNGINFITGL